MVIGSPVDRVVDRVGQVVRVVDGIARAHPALVDRRGQVVEVAVEPAAGQRQARQQLVLQLEPVLHVVGARILAVLVERPDAEVRRQRGEVDLAAHGRIARAAALALRDVVAVDVSPGERRRLLEERVVVARDARGPRAVVPVQRVLERRLRVAEHVVDRGEPRREVAPVRQVLDGREGPGRHEPPLLATSPSSTWALQFS